MNALVAQSGYRAFPENNAGWVESHSWMDGSGGGGYLWITCQRTLTFAADTIIDGEVYHQLRSAGACNGYEIPYMTNPFFYTEPSEVVLRYRQDTIARQVLQYDMVAGEEKLWYDFTLGVGPYPDAIGNVTAPGELRVVALDSIELNDGWHRTQVLGLMYNGMLQDSAFCSIIEGVGSTFGLSPLIGLVPPFEWYDQLDCHQAIGTVVLPLGAMACDLTQHAGATLDRPHRISVFPNPVRDAFTVHGTVAPGTRYALMDVRSVIVQQGELPTSSVDLSGLAPGVYVLLLTDADGRVSGKARVVKE